MGPKLKSDLARIQGGEVFGWADTGFHRTGTRVQYLGYFMIGDEKISNKRAKAILEWVVWDDAIEAYRLSKPSLMVLAKQEPATPQEDKHE